MKDAVVMRSDARHGKGRGHEPVSTSSHGCGVNLTVKRNGKFTTIEIDEWVFDAMILARENVRTDDSKAWCCLPLTGGPPDTDWPDLTPAAIETMNREINTAAECNGRR